MKTIRIFGSFNKELYDPIFRNFKIDYGLQVMKFHVPSDRESNIILSLEPGLYVLKVFVKLDEKNDVFYALLVQIFN